MLSSTIWKIIRRRRFDHFLLMALLTLPFPAASQINDPAYADYFLVGRFGEMCTMCEAIVFCAADQNDTQVERIPESATGTVYHLQTRTFWSQIATIWEWFITNFDPDSLAAAGHERPVAVYEMANGRWSAAQTLKAHVSLDPATIVIGDHTIDRVERRWLKGSNLQPAGFCQRLPLWESLEIIAQHNPAEETP